MTGSNLFGQALPRRIFYDTAKNALARIGDEEFLRTMLAEAEKFGAMLGASGGEIYLWEQAPPGITLQLARERMKSKETKVRISMKTLVRYGDESDVELILNKIDEIDDIGMRYTAFYCLNSIDSIMAIQKLNQIINKTDFCIDKFHYLSLKKNIGGDLCSEWIVSFILDDFKYQIEHYKNEIEKLKSKEQRLTEKVKNNQEDGVWGEIKQIKKEISKFDINPSYRSTKFDAIDLLKQITLSDPDIDRIRESVETTTDIYTKSNLWTLAIHHKLSSFDDLALINIQFGNSNEVLYSVLLAKNSSWSDEKQSEFTNRAIERLKKDKDLLKSWAYDEIIEYLWMREEKCICIDHAIKKFEYILNDNTRYLCELEKYNLDPKKYGSERPKNFNLQSTFQHFINTVILLIDKFPKELLIRIMEIDMECHAGKEKYTQILHDYDSSLVDKKLDQIKDIRQQMWLLSIISVLGKTEFRTKLAIQFLKYMFGGLYNMFPIYIRNLWDLELFENIMKTMVFRDYFRNPFNKQLFHKIDDAVLTQLLSESPNSDYRALIENYLENELPPEIKNILEYWHDVLSKSRNHPS